MNRILPVIKLLIVVSIFVVWASTAQAQFTVNTTTLNNQTVAGVHPRLFLTNSVIGSLRANITNPPTGTHWSDMYVSLKNRSDECAILPPPAYTDLGNDPQLWQRAVGDNLGIFSMSYLMTQQSPPTSDDIWLEAEETPLASPMTLTSSASCSGGAYISTPVGGSANSPNTKPPSASYNFSTLRTGYYHAWALVYAPNSTANSWFLNIDGTEYSLKTYTYGSWVWLVCGSWNLTPGNHVMNLTYQDQGVQFDKFFITSGGTTPTGLGTEEHWLNAKNFALNANGVSPNLNNLVVTTENHEAPSGDELSQTGSWLEPWEGEGSHNTVPVSSATPDAQQTIGVNGGTYDVYVRFKAPYKGHDNFYFEVDNLGYSTPILDGTSSFPYNTLCSPTLFAYNKTLTSPSNGYPYREWIWKKIESSLSLTQGTHTLKVACATGSTNAGCELDRFCVVPVGTNVVDPNKYLVAAAKWAAASCSYPAWSTGTQANDLSAAAQLGGLGIYYDWCYGSLGTINRTSITTKLLSEGGQMYTAFTTSPKVWWYHSYLNNHLQVDLTGLTAAGIAMHNDVSTDTLPWLQASMGAINNTLTDAGSDGVDQEGAGYWGYGTGAMLQYMDMANTSMGANMFSAAPWFAQTANYRVYFNLPLGSFAQGYDTHVNFADDPAFEWYGPDYILRKLASAYNVPTAQWLAEQYDVTGLNAADNLSITDAGQPFMNLLWYNPSIAETSPISANLSNLGDFPDLDCVVSRSGWDGTESLVAYQCGPAMGHGVQSKDKPTWIDWGSNHVHPAANNFCIFGSGDWQIENAGYTGKYTAYENSLQINNVGQLGESSNGTFNGVATANEDSGGVLNPAMDTTLSVSTPVMDYFVGNATEAYATTSDLTKFRRHLLYLKPSNVLVVVDDVTLSSPLPMELRFFPNHVATFTQTGSTYVTTSAHSILDFNVLTAPSQVATTTKIVATTELQNNSTLNRKAYSLATTSNISNMSTAVSFSWSATGSAPNPVTYVQDPDNTAWKFKVGKETMVLDRDMGHSTDENAIAVTTLEAESVALGTSMQTYTDSTASANNYISTTSGTVANTPTDTLTNPSALYSFNVVTTGNYAIWARVQAADVNSNSFYYYINPSGTPSYTSNASTTTYGSWVWVKITGSTSLNAGTNSLGIKYRSPNCKIDQFIITSDTSYTPYGMY